MDFTLPYKCVDCNEYFPVPSACVTRKRRAVCPKCGSVKTKLADMDEVLE